MNISKKKMKKSIAISKKDILSVLKSLDPLKVLWGWLEEAKKESRLREPWAMGLSTSQNGIPSCRTVLLKKVEGESLIFFSNYLSKKGQEMKGNPKAAALFHWDSLEKQICIQGTIQKTNRKLSEEYWSKRQRNSQLSGWISKQSQPVSGRKFLENVKAKAQKQFKNKSIPCPKHWGGYLLLMETIEFWRGHSHRLHDRFLFEKQDSSWKCRRLFP